MGSPISNTPALGSRRRSGTQTAVRVVAIHKYNCYLAIAVQLLKCWVCTDWRQRLFVGPQIARMAQTSQPGEAEVAAENEAEISSIGTIWDPYLRSSLLFGPLESIASSCVPASPTSKWLHVGNIGRGLEATGDESFTATLHIGPTRHLPAHLQKETLQSKGLCTISSRCKVSPAIA
jgi:hypothetical protein